MLSSISADALNSCRDWWVRMPAHAVRTLSFTHLQTAPDASVHADAADLGIRSSAAGITEWHAVHAAGAVSLGWDWVLLNDGPALLRCVAPRTNLRLLDPKGYDILADADALFQLVESIPWKAAVTAAVSQQA